MTQIIRDITEITRAGAEYKATNLAPYGLKGCHASYLAEICSCPGISQDRLAQKICINKSNVARQAAILEDDGFILRKPSQADKRVMELYPTEKTLTLMPEITEILNKWEDFLLADLSEEEVEHVHFILQRMRDKASGWMGAR
jgi:DNA-binding MarR family transcriptional regulator